MRNPFLKKFARQFFAYVLPQSCLACKSVLHWNASAPLCNACEQRLESAPEPCCPHCGDPLSNQEIGAHLCSDCLTDPPPYRVARSAFLLKEPISSLLYALKYSGNETLVPWMAEQMRLRLSSLGSQGWEMILPVPLHRFRLIRRGFNQSLLLARMLGKRLGIPVHAQALVRTRYEFPQTLRSKKERVEKKRGAFECSKSFLFQQKKVLLIDDVFTTGATVRECAHVLVEQGATVDVFTLARTALHNP